MALTKAQRLKRLDSYFRSAVDHPAWVSWRENARKCFEYRDGDQWTSAELRTLKERHQPATVNNQVKVTVDRMVGRFVQSKTRVAFRGRNPVDAQSAGVMDEIFRYIAQNTRLEFEERDAFEDGATGGFACLYTDVTFDDLLQPEIRIRSVDPFEIYPDPWSRRYDWNEDANWICWARWLHFDEAVELYPKHARRLTALSNTTVDNLRHDDFRRDDYIDFDENGNPRRVRVVECWYREKSREKVLLVEQPDGSVVTVSPEDFDAEQLQFHMSRGAKEITRIVPKMRVGVFTGGLLLDDQESPHDSDQFPFVPYFVHRRKSGEPYSTISIALPLQEAINKRESKALHLLNSNQAIFQQGAVRDKAELAAELARPDGLIEVRRVGEISIEKNNDIANSQYLMHQQAQGDFRRVTGVNPEALGEASEVRSGVGIARKQMMTDMILSPAFDNFRRTRAILASLVVDLVRTYYTEPKAMLILDDMGNQNQMNVSQSVIDSIKFGLYDAVVDEVPDITTLQQEQTGLLLQNLPAFLQYGPGWAQVLIEMSDLKNKDALLQRVQQLTPQQPPEPRYNLSITWDQLSAEEKVAFAGQLGMEALAEAQDRGGEPTTNSVRRETEISRELIRAGAMGAQAQRATQEQQKQQDMREDREEAQQPAPTGEQEIG